jgi:predicted small secreted protein
MNKTLSTILSLALLLGMAPLVSACHATAGAGKDMSAAGQAVTDSANRNTPDAPR